jgi:hypothetical protein
MNEEFPNDPYTHQHRQNLFAGEIQRVIRRHVEYPASNSQRKSFRQPLEAPQRFSLFCVLPRGAAPQRLNTYSSIHGPYPA